ncbi:hypothetical protein [Vibrio tritonius]|uniref:hypothetical protein n=1 Tax=Vibrio tritonius TaxID=1435069 RepID=UPI00315D441F
MTKLTTEKWQKINNTDCTPSASSAFLLFGDERMSSTQFEYMKEQLKLLSPQQLRSLQGEISHSLEHNKNELLTEEERHMLASLFS